MNVQGQRVKVKVTAWHDVVATKSYNSGMDKLSKVKVGENYLRVSTLQGVQGH